MKGARRYWVLLLMLAFAQAAGVVPAAGHGAPSPRDPAAGRSIGIKLLDAPENRRADPRAHAYIVDHVAPGSTIERRVEITNESSTPMHVNVYAAAATIAKGEFTFAPERTPNELTGWTSFDTADLELAASETARVRATIRVPGDAAAGERYGVIWAQTSAPSDHSHNLTMLGRVGVRMYVDVGAGGEPPSDFKIERLYPTRARDGRGVVRARIHNTGGRALDISGALSLLDGPGGRHAGPFPTARTGATLAPGDRADAVVPLDAPLPNGPWAVELTLRSGLVEHTTRATVTFPTTPGDAGAVTASAARRWRFPTPAVAGLSVLALTALCLPLSRFLRRRR
ncbi:peptidase [Streptomyces sp. FH025]|uniref:COG1470 family protein n=1 Tax=Streptomyces sp. FH025 TaxID=2815937 RepID=UPI001A9EC844|nr:peptidase [Streptomyces sp. FH025]MBO1413090.1 peptidase [Streptomyces sp. FH025]